MTLNEYKLSCELFGHSLDVRAVAEGINCIISASRDKTAKIWNAEGAGYVEATTLKDHSNFISSLCVLEGGQLICTGSNDATICVYTPGSVVPITVLKGHTNTVSTMAAGFEPNSLVSGSWDKTARIWTIAGFGPSQSNSLVGHEAAIWAVVTLSTGYYVTGSADRNIYFWNKKGEKVKVFKGHTDCVRGLVEIGRGGLISCGNDATIKIWSEDGECVKELFGHSNYIYTMALNKAIGQDVFVTGSEDSTIRMWNSSGELGDAITLPAQSVWSVACLANGDIVTGTSDAVVRVFTKDPSRYANETVMKAFNVAVQQRKVDTEMELGGMKVSELPGPESLLTEGEEGQTKIVRHTDGKLMCYQWTKNEWICLGDVTGASGGSQNNSGKVLHEGIEYDFVFNVDISDSAPAIKLPYNVGEDPWMAAQKFIHKHELPQVYLEQVANFIIKNSERTAPSMTAPVSSGYQDPFTGGARYIPGGGSSNSNNAGMVDPFTGASSYRSAEARSEVTSNSPRTTISTGIRHFPHSKRVTFDICDSSKVLNKLNEFNSKVESDILRISTEQLQDLDKLTQVAPKDYENAIQTLHQLLKWPKDLLFPILDIFRLAVRHDGICSVLVTPDCLQKLIESCAQSAANQLMVTRCFVNMLNHEVGVNLVKSRFLDIVREFCRIKQGSQNLQIAISSFYLNVTVWQIEFADREIVRLTTEGLLESLKWMTDLEALYRAYQSLGNLTCTPFGQITSAQIISVDVVVDKIRDFMSDVLPTGFEKLNEIARDLTAAL
ncbi:Phospholipase A-2-activating protein [Pseudolycoriella hygida]|uniref:Phospholipase A-2-activating protein n=1 Tax=Pseudolycoriella hygida TaxID=35572 RepID=A0A9Q0NFB6_9DIPT|nr:Phospholipase A-2-activating protein [Pseudolycoriella hygida]